MNSNLVIKGRQGGGPPPPGKGANEFIRDERQFIRTRITAGASPTRNSLCLTPSCENESEQQREQVTETLQRQYNKQNPRNYQQYSTYKPLLKSSSSSSANRPALTTSIDANNSTTTTTTTTTSNSIVTSNRNSHSTFKTNKVDYV